MPTPKRISFPKFLEINSQGTINKASLTTGGVAEDGIASRASADGLGVAEDGGDVVAT